MNQYSRPFRSPGRCSRVVADTASSSSGIRASNSFSSVPLPAPDVPVTTTTRLLPVEEANQLSALTVGQSSHRLRLADPAHVQEARRLHPPELRYSHQHVEDLRSRHVLGRVTEDLFNLDASILQILLQFCAPDANVVRAFQRFHALIERPDRCLGLGLGRHHERGSLTTEIREASAYFSVLSRSFN